MMIFYFAIFFHNLTPLFIPPLYKDSGGLSTVYSRKYPFPSQAVQASTPVSPLNVTACPLPRQDSQIISTLSIIDLAFLIRLLP